MHYTDLTHIEIDHQSILHNFTQLQEVAAPARTIPVIKANAYGHGMIEIAHTLQKANCYKLAVATINEALILRKEGITKPIIVIGHTQEKDWPQAATLEIEIAIYNQEQINQLQKTTNQYNTPLKIHLKIETGMNRLGFQASHASDIVSEITKTPHVIEGIYTHFADAETPESNYTQKQISTFKSALDAIKKTHPEIIKNIPDIHTAATGATLTHPDSRFTTTRIGIGLYGMWPSSETKLLAIHSDKIKSITLKPPLTWKTHIAHIQQIAPGQSVGYGCTFTANQPMKVATLPIGYADGYPRALSNKGRVLINDMPTNIIGRICMNLMMVDVTHIPDANCNDEVVLIGSSKNHEITAEEIANHAQTINYEITTRLNWDIPKKHINQ